VRVPRVETACSACCVFRVLVWCAVRVVRVACWSCVQHAVLCGCVLQGVVPCFACRACCLFLRGVSGGLFLLRVACCVSCCSAPGFI
jgi:hypothetical protein